MNNEKEVISEDPNNNISRTSVKCIHKYFGRGEKGHEIFRQTIKRECLKRMKEARQRKFDENRQGLLSLLRESERDLRYQVVDELRRRELLETHFYDEQPPPQHTVVDDEIFLTSEDISNLIDELELEWKQFQDSYMLEQQLEFEERSLSVLIADYEEQKSSSSSSIHDSSNSGDSRDAERILCPLCRHNTWYNTYYNGFIRCVCGLSIDIQVSLFLPNSLGGGYRLLNIIQNFLWKEG